MSKFNLIGHKFILDYLISLYERDKLPNKILLSGKKGIGKSLLVKQFMYNIQQDLSSKLLVENETNSNILNIKRKNDKKNIEIEQIREIIKFTKASPSLAKMVS